MALTAPVWLQQLELWDGALSRVPVCPRPRPQAPAPHRRQEQGQCQGNKDTWKTLGAPQPSPRTTLSS